MNATTITAKKKNFKICNSKKERNWDSKTKITICDTCTLGAKPIVGKEPNLFDKHNGQDENLAEHSAGYNWQSDVIFPSNGSLIYKRNDYNLNENGKSQFN